MTLEQIEQLIIDIVLRRAAPPDEPHDVAEWRERLTTEIAQIEARGFVVNLPLL